MSDDDATKRSRALDAVNVALADIAIAKKRVDVAATKHRKLISDMKSEMGTAGAELRKHEAAYTKARDKLLALTPELPSRDAIPDIVQMPVSMPLGGHRP